MNDRIIIICILLLKPRAIWCYSFYGRVWNECYGCFELYRVFNLFNLDLLGFSFVLSSPLRRCPSFTGFYLVLLGFTGFYLVLLGFIGFYWVYLVFVGFTFYYWICIEFPPRFDRLFDV